MLSRHAAERLQLLAEILAELRAIRALLEERMSEPPRPVKVRGPDHST